MNDTVRSLERPRLPIIGPATAKLADGMEREISAQAQQAHHLSIQKRTAARQDATIVVARARSRGGASPTSWSAFDADAVHLITDLLLKLQGQEPTPLDPSFQTLDDTLARAAAHTSRIEEAIKRDDRGEQGLEADSGRAPRRADPQDNGSS
jgi:hypothetical protein